MLFVLALAYGLWARSFELTTMTDPVGPRAFPYLIAVLTGLVGLYLIVDPDRAGERWPKGAVWVRIIGTLVTLVGYAYLLVPLGFIVATTLVVFIMAVVFRGPIIRSGLSALLFSLVTYALFAYALGLSLPAGWLFG